LNVFDKFYEEYDKWYDENSAIYLSELEVIKKTIPFNKIGLEIGVGTGRFANKLGIQFGIDPSFSMLKLAHSRGVSVVQGYGEELPFKDDSFDYLVIIFTLAFVKNVNKVFSEISRVIKKGGYIICGIIDKDSFL
jgi:ubiquinone/menaquinone biosynthesis C-methylase UbiE